LRASIVGNHIAGYRPRGGYGQFDTPIVRSPVEDATVPVYSTNLSPRTGTGADKTPIHLTDWADGAYDGLLQIDGEQLKTLALSVPLVVVEIWSECNVQDPLPSSQPKVPDWSTANWERAFLHTVALWRDMGVPSNVWLGTSVAGLQRGFGTYLTPNMLAVSQFAGFDAYSTVNTYHPLLERTAKFRSFLGSTPLIVCESGVDVTQDYQAWFADATKLATTTGVRGIFYTDYDNWPKGNYVVDPGSPMYGAFSSFATAGVWR
jgi:hypothetical protein